MSDRELKNPHLCPSCGATQPHFPRYPWHFCNDCRKTASDRDGRTLSFSNTSPSGGFSWYYSDDPLQQDDHAQGVICAIKGRPVFIHEARFGGIVAEPIPDNPLWHNTNREHIPNLWARGHIKTAQSRLKPV